MYHTYLSSVFEINKLHVDHKYYWNILDHLVENRSDMRVRGPGLIVFCSGIFLYDTCIRILQKWILLFTFLINSNILVKSVSMLYLIYRGFDVLCGNCRWLINSFQINNFSTKDFRNVVSSWAYDISFIFWKKVKLS